MLKLLIEFCNDNNKKIDDNPDLDIVTDFEKSASNALNYFKHILHVFPFITKHFQKTSKSWSLFNVFETIQNSIY